MPKRRENRTVLQSAVSLVKLGLLATTGVIIVAPSVIIAIGVWCCTERKAKIAYRNPPMTRWDT